jgi:hypothetical protein
MTVQQDEDGEPPGLDLMDIKELFPSDWHEVPVSVSSYRAFRLQPKELSPPKLFDLLGVKVQLGWGTAPYFKSRLWMDPQTNGGLIVRVETVSPFVIKGPYVQISPIDERCYAGEVTILVGTRSAARALATGASLVGTSTWPRSSNLALRRSPCARVESSNFTLARPDADIAGRASHGLSSALEARSNGTGNKWARACPCA